MCVGSVPDTVYRSLDPICAVQPLLPFRFCCVFNLSLVFAILKWFAMALRERH